MLVMTTLIMAIGIYFTFSQVGTSTGRQAIPLRYFPGLTAIWIAYCSRAQAIKIRFIKKYGYN
jgi:Mg2+-importing ATPase